jgi:hypothetical protein
VQLPAESKVQPAQQQSRQADGKAGRQAGRQTGRQAGHVVHSLIFDRMDGRALGGDDSTALLNEMTALRC